MMKLKDEADFLIAKTGKLRRRQCKHISIIDRQGTRIGCIKRTYDMQQGAFSGTGRSRYSNNLATLNVQPDILQNMQCTKAFRDIFCG